MNSLRSQTPRTLVPQECHSTIDTILKDLKLCLRRIHGALVTHADEYQLLQRIYYKNKNQHRGALFWRRVEEMRRYSERLKETNAFLTLEEVRNSFFDPGAKQNSKLLKGAWTYAPSKESVTNVIGRLQTCETLLHKMQEKSLQAYQSFTLAMESGAFVQLLLILVAIVSRLRMLSIEIREAVSMSRSSMAKFLSLDIALPTNLAKIPSDISPSFTNTPSGTVGDGNDEDMDRPMTSEQAGVNPSLVQRAVPRVNVKRRLQAAQSNKPAGKMQDNKINKVKNASDEIDEIFAIMA